MKRCVVTRKTIYLSAVFLIFAAMAYAEPGNSQLGVYLQELNSDFRSHFGYGDSGVMITGVIKDTGAEKAGLAEQDIITEINGKKVTSIRDIKTMISQTKPGDEIDVKIFRKGTLKKIPVFLTEKKQPDVPAPRKWIYYARVDRPWIGIQMQDLNPQLAEYFKVASGVLITEIAKESPAEKASLKAGDVITGWNGKEIQGIEDLLAQFRKSKPDEEVNLSFKRNGKQKKTRITLAEPRDKEDRFFSFYLDKDDADNPIFHLRRPGMERPWGDHFPFPVFQDPEKREPEQNLIPRMDALEKEMGVIKKQLERLLEKANTK